MNRCIWEDPIGLEQLEENNIISVDLKDMALMTLYADYQRLPIEKRAEDIYLYINISPFCELHIEDMFYVGREQLEDAERFWQDWIHLLMTIVFLSCRKELKKSVTKRSLGRKIFVG